MMQSPVIVLRKRLVWLAVRWCLVGAVVGAVSTTTGAAYYLSTVQRIEIAEPVVERAAKDYSVIRIPFYVPQLPNAEAWCHLVVDHRKGGWTLRC